jgi:hypothetical protein
MERPSWANHRAANNWVERAAAIPAALEKAVSRKAAKRYGSATSLLVYLNINDYGIRQTETEAAIGWLAQVDEVLVGSSAE